MKTHKLKCWPEFFEAVRTGRKRFEMRYDDRGYAVGDMLFLQEWDPQTEKYSGDACNAEVLYLVRGHEVDGFGLDPRWVIMSIAVHEPRGG